MKIKKFFVILILFWIPIFLFAQESQHPALNSENWQMKFGVWFSPNAEMEIQHFGEEEVEFGLDFFLTIPFENEKWNIAPCFNFASLSAGVFTGYKFDQKNDLSGYLALLKRVSEPKSKGLIGISKSISLGSEDPIHFEIYLEGGNSFEEWDPFVSIGFLFPITTKIKEFTRRE